MSLTFYKYQGTGNDFVIIDNREGVFDINNTALVKQLCDRRFGIGADGLMLLQNKEGYDFEMVYYNADGNESSMCGNGGRCIVAFANRVGVVGDKARFLAVDGEHEAIISDGKAPDSKWVSLHMNDVQDVEEGDDYYYLNTGSPHYVAFENNIGELDVYNKGKAIRYNDRFKAEGTNVNFIEWKDDVLHVRTYERGVEDETYSCGTGVTAAAIAASVNGVLNGSNQCNIQTLGGDISVKFEKQNNLFTNIWLEGPATFVYKGEV